MEKREFFIVSCNTFDILTNNSITCNPQIPETFFSTFWYFLAEKKFNLFLIDCQSCNLITVSVSLFMSFACIEMPFVIFFIFMTFSQIPLKLIFAEKGTRERGRESGGTFIFYYLKPNWSHHMGPVWQIAFPFSIALRIFSPFIEFIFLWYLLHGAAHRLLREQGITGWDNLWDGRKRKWSLRQILWLLCWSLQRRLWPPTYLKVFTWTKPKRAETCKFSSERMYFKARGGGGGRLHDKLRRLRKTLRKTSERVWSEIVCFAFSVFSSANC